MPDGPGPPRVLMVCDSLLKYTAALARGVAEAGAEVKLLGRDHGLEFGGDPDAMRRYVAATLEGRVEHIVLAGRVREPRHWREAAAAGRRLRRWRPDVVHYQENVVEDLGLLLAAPPRRGATAFTLHDPVAHAEGSSSGWPQRLENALLRRAGVVFVHAEALLEQTRASRGVNGPIVVIPHGIATPRRQPPPSAPTLLAFGRIHPYKGLDVLLEAMGAVWERLPEARLRIVGQGTLPDHPALADPRVGVENSYLPEEEVPELFAAATCVVLSYTEASQSGVGSLAKQHGRPIVASDVGGLPELVGDGGRIVAAGDPAALAEALVEVAGSAELADELGRRAAASVAGEAGWADVGARTLDAYATYLDAPMSAARRESS